MAEKQKYIALLRGINIGPHHKIPMADLRETLGKMGFQNVKTLLNTGNVVFEAAQADEKLLAEKLAAHLQSTFGFPVPVIIRTADGIEELIAANPFEGVNVTKKTRLYATFLPNVPASGLSVPYTSLDGAYQIISILHKTVFSVLDLDKSGSVDAMKILEKEFGKNITTRNWNTVVKIGQM